MLHSLESAYHVSAYKSTLLTDVILWSQGYKKEKVSNKKKTEHIIVWDAEVNTLLIIVLI